MQQDMKTALTTRFLERQATIEQFEAAGQDRSAQFREIYDQFEEQLLRERFESLLDRNGFSDQDIGQIMENLSAGNRPAANYLGKKDAALVSKLFMQAEGDILRAKNAAHAVDYDGEEPQM